MSRAESKAWNTLKEILGDEAYHTLKNKGEPIEVKGSSGGRYFLYPRGQVVKIGKSEAKIGEFKTEFSVDAFFGRTSQKDMPFPDILISAYLSITQKEDELIENWKCGNYEISYNSKANQTERNEIEPPEPLIEESSWNMESSLNFIIFLAFLILFTGSIVYGWQIGYGYGMQINSLKRPLDVMVTLSPNMEYENDEYDVYIEYEGRMGDTFKFQDFYINEKTFIHDSATFNIVSASGDNVILHIAAEPILESVEVYAGSTAFYYTIPPLILLICLIVKKEDILLYFENKKSGDHE